MNNVPKSDKDLKESGTSAATDLRQEVFNYGFVYYNHIKHVCFCILNVCGSKEYSFTSHFFSESHYVQLPFLKAPNFIQLLGFPFLRFKFSFIVCMILRINYIVVIRISKIHQQLWLWGDHDLENQEL